jgi:hypothetical protein
MKLNSFAKTLSSFQTGLIYHYTFIILVGVLIYINIGFFFKAWSHYFTFEILSYYFFLSLTLF